MTKAWPTTTSAFAPRYGVGDTVEVDYLHETRTAIVTEVWDGLAKDGGAAYKLDVLVPITRSEGEITKLLHRRKRR